MQFLVALFTVALAVPSPSPSRLIPLCNLEPKDACSAPFDAAKYLGVWYEQGRSAIIRNTFEKDNNCVRATYSLNADGTIKVNNGAIDAKTGKFINIIGSAEIASPAVLKVSFGDQTLGGRIGAFFQGIAGPNYYVKQIWVDARGNYKKALVGFGKNLPGFAQYQWVLTRDEFITDVEFEDAIATGKALGFDSKNNNFERTPCTDEQRLTLKANI
jgi:apolipoprotein D and lipocalin family protein